MFFWVIALGNTMRVTQAKTAQEACLNTFGCVIGDRMTVTKLPGNPSRMPDYRRTRIYDDLKKRHREKTGEIIV
jgi:hypothetical protein